MVCSVDGLDGDDSFCLGLPTACYREGSWQRLFTICDNARKHIARLEPFAFNVFTVAGGKFAELAIRSVWVALGCLRAGCKLWPLIWYECQCWFALTPPVSRHLVLDAFSWCDPTSIAAVANFLPWARLDCPLQWSEVLSPFTWIVVEVDVDSRAAIFSRIVAESLETAGTETGNHDRLGSNHDDSDVRIANSEEISRHQRIEIFGIRRHGIQWL